VSRRARLRAAAASPSARALAGTVLGSAPGLALPFLITLRFGATNLTDAFYFAYAISSFSASLCNGSVAASLLPSLARAREYGGTPALQERARTLSRQSVLAVGGFHVVVSIGALLVVVLGTPWDADTQLLTILCLGSLSLFVVAVALSTVQVAALQALGDFFSPTASVGLRAIVPLVALLVVPITDAGLVTLALLTWVGELLRIAWLHRRVRVHARRAEDDLRARATNPGADEAIWVRVAHNGAALAVLSANPLVTRAIAAHHGPGSVTLVELAERLLFVPWLALSTSVVVVAAARWSRLLAQGDRAALIVDYRRTRRRLAVLSSAAAVSIALLAAGALLVIGERLVGDQAGLLIAMTTLLLITGLPPTIMAILTQRFLTVVGDTRALPALAGVGFIVNAAASVAGYAAFGLVGLMLGSSAYRLAMLALSSRLAQRWIAAQGAVGAAGRGGVPAAVRASTSSDPVPPSPQEIAS
jgi:peptidoglycan biosynthesis protein MviN/MurJ (putative lipid II flippase)